MKGVDSRTLDTPLRREAHNAGYGDYIPRWVIDKVIGKHERAVRRVLVKENVPRLGKNGGTLYQVSRVAAAFSAEGSR